MRTLLQKISLLFSSCLVGLITTAQFNNPNGQPPKVTPIQPVQTPQPVQPAQPMFNFKKVNANLGYAFIIDRPTAQNRRKETRSTSICR